MNKPGCTPTVVCGPKKIGSCSYSVYSPSICPFEYPFLYNQLHQTFSYFTLFAPFTATPRAPSPSRLQSPLFMDPTNYPNLSLRLYQISWYCLQMFFRCIHCIYYPSTFSGQLLRWTKKLILLSFFLVPMVINKIYKITYLAYMAHWGAYLSAWNIVKWGIPETILQNAVQARFAR